MVAVLFSVAFVAVLYFISQGVTGDTADAPGHCSGSTEEDMSERLSYPALVQLAEGAGFDVDSATAAAIAVAESGGDPNAYNPETQAGAPEGKGSYGLWQIYLHAHPEYEGQDLTDPETNANAAYAIYVKAGGFKPWSTFKSGAYQKYVQA